MEVSILCNLNRARSPFGQSVLEHFFPEHFFESAGISAVDEIETNEGVRSIAKEWKLPCLKQISENISTKKEKIISSDLVILAESSMESDLRSLGFTGRSIPFDDLRIETSFIPCDPLELSLHALRLELAKVAYCCVQIMRINFNETNQNLISTVIPESEVDTAYAYAYAKLEQSIKGGIIIDADFRAPTARQHSSDFEVNFMEVENLDSINLDRISAHTILTPAREYGNPESILLSHTWRDFLKSISTVMPVYLISAPRRTEEKRIADSYLCAIWSHRVTIINS
jgi:protein-tyrosine-phosphatase